jgi:hypothetical protein
VTVQRDDIVYVEAVPRFLAVLETLVFTKSAICEPYEF